MTNVLPEETQERQFVDDVSNDPSTIPSDENNLAGMAEAEALEIPEPQALSTDPRANPEKDLNDVVVDFLSKLEFSSNIFSELDAANWDAKKFQYYYQTPDLFVLRNAIGILNVYDEESKERTAMINLLQWMMVRMATDPYWLSRFGWFMRFMSAHMNPSSYWPLKYHEVYTPKYWKDNTLNKKKKSDINTEIRDPDDVFNW